MFKSLSTSLIVRGILALAVGIIALAWPRSRSSRWSSCSPCTRSSPLACRPCGRSAAATPARSSGTCCSGWLDLAAGAIALAWPGPTALVLVLIVGVWAVIAGLVEIFAAFRAGEAAGTRALLILGGLVSIAFGVVLFARPGIGAITLALLFGLFNLIYGAWTLVQGIELRRTGKTLQSAVPEKTVA